MKYFINETEREASHSTCYHEFFKGKWDENTDGFWNPDSMNIDDDFLYLSGMESLLGSIVENYDPFGVTTIHKNQWEKIYAQAEKIGGNLFEAIQEITSWVEDTFRKHDVFTILGI